MMAATKSMIALGFAAAMFVGSATPTLARTAHARAQAPDVSTPWQGYAYEGYRTNGNGPYARALPPDSGYRPGEFVPPDRPMQTWDAYGLRWD